MTQEELDYGYRLRMQASSVPRHISEEHMPNADFLYWLWLHENHLRIVDSLNEMKAELKRLRHPLGEEKQNE